MIAWVKPYRGGPALKANPYHTRCSLTYQAGNRGGSDATLPSKMRVPSRFTTHMLVALSDTSNPTKVSMAALPWFNTAAGSTGWKGTHRD